jgi:hypothetical protein
MVACLTSDQKAACSNHSGVSKWIILCFRSTYNLRQPSGNLSSRFHSSFGASFDFSDVDFIRYITGNTAPDVFFVQNVWPVCDSSKIQNFVA